MMIKERKVCKTKQIIKFIRKTRKVFTIMSKVFPFKRCKDEMFLISWWCVCLIKITCFNILTLHITANWSAKNVSLNHIQDMFYLPRSRCDMFTFVCPEGVYKCTDQSMDYNLYRVYCCFEKNANKSFKALYQNDKIQPNV